MLHMYIQELNCVAGKCEKNQESIYSLERDLTLRRHVNGIHVSGLAWSHSTKVMYYSDSTHKLIGAFDFEINQGTLSEYAIVPPTQCMKVTKYYVQAIM